METNEETDFYVFIGLGQSLSLSVPRTQTLDR